MTSTIDSFREDGTAVSAAESIVSKSPRELAWARLSRDKFARVALGVIIFYLFVAAFAPVICAVSPLLKNKSELRDYAHIVYRNLKDEFGRVMWDDNGNIGKRYRRQDEIGTPWCIVIDFDTLEDDSVTIRDRDTGKQDRIKKDDIVSYIKGKMN
jgi:glycyl-tRNA synthetase (class II)